MGGVVEGLNLRIAWRWMALAGLVGAVAGLGAIAFQWATTEGLRVFWAGLIGYTPPTPGGEPLPFPSAAGPPVAALLVLVPALGGLVSGFLVYRFAPEAEGHGTDAAIRAYHREGGRIAPRVPIVKLIASAVTLSSGGSAGREGPIAQIGAGFGSVLAGWLRLTARERRILMAAGVAAGVGAIFRAPLAGALFASEVLYREPDFEPEVLLPALISSIVAYCVYGAVHGFGHLFTGTAGFTFAHPATLLVYAVLGLVVALGAIAYVTVFDATRGLFSRMRVSRYLRPAIGAAAAGAIGVAAWKATGELGALSVLGSGYGMLQDAVTAAGAAGPPVALLLVVALAKIVTTALTIGSGGSGGVFGPAMVIGGCLGAAVGSVFHAMTPSLAPDVGPFTIVGMAGFFAGAANTPVSTLIMVGDVTGNYALLLPAMLAVAISYFVAKRWTIYPEQVPTRMDSAAHRGELMVDVLDELRVGAVLPAARGVASIRRDTPLPEILRVVARTRQHQFPVLDASGALVGIVSLGDLRQVIHDARLGGLVVAHDLATEPAPAVKPDDTLLTALRVLSVNGLDEVPVVADDGSKVLVGFLGRDDITSAYERTMRAARGESDGDVGTAAE